MDTPIMGLVTVFIAVAIILGIAVSILGSTSSSINCDSMQGSNVNGTDNHQTTGFQPTDTTTVTGPDVGWAKACFEVSQSSQSSFQLLTVLLVVIAAVAILVVVRLLY